MPNLALTQYFTDGRSIRMPIKYEVLGLPDEQSASIVKLKTNCWQLARTVDGIPGEGPANYKSPEAALTALRHSMVRSKSNRPAQTRA
jgi:hypothetical protein